MALKDLVPFARSRSGRRSLPSVLEGEEQPLAAFQRRAERLMDMMDALSSGLGFESSAWTRSFSPNIDVAEDAESIKIRAELPGMTSKDVELSLTDDALTIRGEKKESSEREGQEGRSFECSYGMFQRRIPLMTKVDTDNITTEFKNGVLYINLAKSPEARKAAKRIPIKSD